MLTYKLSKNLTFNTVENERNKLIAFIENKEHDRICLDLGELSICDSAGLALIFDIKKLCHRLGKHLHIQAIPEDAQNLAAFYDVQDLLKNS